MELYSQKHAEAPFHDGTFERWSKTRSHEYPFHANDGVSFYMSKTDDTPDADWLSDG